MSNFVEDQACNGSTEAGQNEYRSLFDNFRPVSILNQDAQQKTIYLHGKTHEEHGEGYYLFYWHLEGNIFSMGQIFAL